MAIPGQHEDGHKVGDICGENCISQATFFNNFCYYILMPADLLICLFNVAKQQEQDPGYQQWSICKRRRNM